MNKHNLVLLCLLSITQFYAQPLLENSGGDTLVGKSKKEWFFKTDDGADKANNGHSNTLQQAQIFTAFMHQPGPFKCSWKKKHQTLHL